MACITTACSAGSADKLAGPRDDSATGAPEVINGDTDFTGKEYQRDRTVHIHTPSDRWCSGTTLIPNTILTARHCVTSDGSIEGPLGVATNFRARIRNIAPAPAPAPAEICTGPSRDPSCARGRRILDFATTLDIAVVELENPLSHPDLPVPFTPLDLDTRLADYLDTSRIITGWGQNTCDEGQGTLRWGQVNVMDVTPDTLSLSNGSTGQNVWRGDSGGPTWGNTLPYSTIGVHSTAVCGFVGNDVPLVAHLSELHDALASIIPATVSRELGSLTDVDPLPATGSNWQVQSGRLRQLGTADRNFALLRGLALQQLVATEASVNISGSESGASGVVLNYYDANHYVLCELTAKQLLLIGRDGPTDTILDSVPRNGAASTDVKLAARMQPNAAGKDAFTCTLSTGAGEALSASGAFPRLTAGRTGVFNWNNPNAAYSHFVARRL